MKAAEKGYAIVEVMITMVITAVIVPAVVMTVLQAMRIGERNNSYITAQSQVQNAGFWITRDGAMAQTILNDDPETPTVEFITLVWTNWESGYTHRIAYLLQDSSGGLKKLVRQETVRNADGVQTADFSTRVADYLVAGPTFSSTGQLWILAVTADFGSRTASAEYEVYPRVNL
ncbi:MAG: hypothetical protein HYY29_02050 [Chloroflexi bacterium]|nr:hypothetical protein [Chloroflexota bacterium]